MVQVVTEFIQFASDYILIITILILSIYIYYIFNLVTKNKMREGARKVASIEYDDEENSLKVDPESDISEDDKKVIEGIKKRLIKRKKIEKQIENLSDEELEAILDIIDEFEEKEDESEEDSDE